MLTTAYSGRNRLRDAGNGPELYVAFAGLPDIGERVRAARAEAMRSFDEAPALRRVASSGRRIADARRELVGLKVVLFHRANLIGAEDSFGDRMHLTRCI